GPSESYRYDHTPACVLCQHCGILVTTTITYESGLLTWSVSAMMCLTGCWFGCCLIPFCMRHTKDVVHTCPVCHTVLGVYRNC
ncbi:unnamed protein product, partial [Candidula unifasciata]